MGSRFKLALVGSAIGLVLAALGWLVWLLASFALGADATDHLPVLGFAVGLSVAAALTATGVTAFLKRPTSKPRDDAHDRLRAECAELKKRVHAEQLQNQRLRKKKRQRHPLDKNPYLARVTPSLRWHSMSRALERLLKGHFVGKAIFQIVHPEDVPAVDKTFTQAREKRQVQQTLCRFLLGDASGPQPAPAKDSLRSDTKLLHPLTPGSFLYLRLDVWPRFDRAGKFQRYVCRFVDMTPLVRQKEMELRLARKMLSRARKRLRAVAIDMHRLKLSYRELYQNAPVMYFSLDNEGRLVTVNDTLLSTLGYERPELQNKNYTLLLAPPASRSYTAIARNMPSQPGESETQWRKKDGTRFDVWLHTVPVYDEAGNFVRNRNAALDLSEKNRLANELRARGDELERANVGLRTINAELEAFTHVVSHDLKEPLRTLQAYSHLLAEEQAAQLGPDGFQYINHLIRASRRLGTLIDELLNLSQAGRITREPKAFNLLEIVATARQDLVDLIQRKEAIVLTEGSLPDVVGDPVRITQLLTNLVANGLKYNQNPAPKVTIGATTTSDEPGRAVIFVRDNGIGIDAAFHQQIFGIFRRLHQDNEFEGTGAGLAICKKIVEGHGGRIWVESTVGVGATFFFTLPRSPIGHQSPPANGKPAAKPGVEQPSSRQRRSVLQTVGGNGKAPHIVLVEDQADVAMIIQKLGKRDGIAITWFPTGEDAWVYLQNHGADLLLLDVNLPGISGVDLCKRLRTLTHLAQTPVAMFTPDHDEEKLEEYHAAGADFFLTKDLLCEPTAWQQKIKELIEQIRPASAH